MVSKEGSALRRQGPSASAMVDPMQGEHHRIEVADHLSQMQARVSKHYVMPSSAFQIGNKSSLTFDTLALLRD